MSETSTPGHSRRTRKARRLSLAGAAGLGAAVMAFTLVAGTDSATTAASAASDTSAASAAIPAAAPVAWSQAADSAQPQTAHHGRRAEKAHAPVRADHLNGWIRESLGIMKKHDIPGTYAGLYKNIMRESSGNPSAINGWDVNAREGDPSIGLLQVIRPTFQAYHVPGTADSQYNPVANIVAAANYAAARYGSIDNVDSAY
ncbi:transglycosylase SLT domain-containing protein [Streptomyces sp. NPDC002104]